MDPVVISITDFYSWNVREVKNGIDLAKKRSQKILPVVINSYGGNTFNMFQMVDALQASGMEIRTILNGVAMSAGAAIFAIGKKRYMSPNSTIMIHDPSYMNWGKQSEIKSMSDHIEKLKQKYYSIFDSAANREEGFFKQLVKENDGADLFFDTRQAVDNGLVTDVGVPEMSEIFETFSFSNSQPKSGVFTEHQKYAVLCQYIPKSESDFADAETKPPAPSASEHPQPPNNNFNHQEENKPMDIFAVLASLKDEQKTPILALQSEHEKLKGKLANIESDHAKALEIEQKKVISAEKKADNQLIDLAVSLKKISKADADDKKEIMSELPAGSKAKEKLLNQVIGLFSSESVVPVEIDDKGEKTADLSQKPGSEGAKARSLIDLAAEHKINLGSKDGYLKALELQAAQK